MLPVELTGLYNSLTNQQNDSTQTKDLVFQIKTQNPLLARPDLMLGFQEILPLPGDPMYLNIDFQSMRNL